TRIILSLHTSYEIELYVHHSTYPRSARPSWLSTSRVRRVGNRIECRSRRRASASSASSATARSSSTANPTVPILTTAKNAAPLPHVTIAVLSAGTIAAMIGETTGETTAVRSAAMTLATTVVTRTTGDAGMTTATNRVLGGTTTVVKNSKK